ncbi:hypothetical protein ACP4OV_020287 [Aristida adscensionis]
MASSPSSSPLSSGPSPLLEARQDHPPAAMAGAPLGSPTGDHEGNQIKAVPYRLRRQQSEILRAQYIDVRELRICAGTWNVGGRCPPSELDIQEWFDTEETADIYVLGSNLEIYHNCLANMNRKHIAVMWRRTYSRRDKKAARFQEIIPLEAGYMIGTEDNRPVAVWEHIIHETLNKKYPNKSKFKCNGNPGSPSRFNPSDYVPAVDDQFIRESNNDNDGELHPLSERDTNIVINNNGVHDKPCKPPTFGSNERKQKGKDCSHSEKLGMILPGEPLDMLGRHLQDTAKLSTSAVSLQSLDLACDVNVENRFKRQRPQFVRIVSKQMVGVFISIWVRQSLQKHIQNLRVSIVGVGARGYTGNKGSISVSMSIHQTHFCFVCCHLASGEKVGDELKRNAHVEAIHRRTEFNSVPTVRVPQRIYDHERIIWLGDLNYRINLSYEMAHELISKQDWDGLFENDQLKRELSKGCAFDGWVEGVIRFPPTYKYEFNSEKYVSDETKSGRRTPAWCDRILSYGKGIKLLSYNRAELTFSDHRPVTAVYTVDIEVFCHKKLQRALTFTIPEAGDHQLLGRKLHLEQKANGQ